ncbi:MAG TPA: DUF2064 domain-containing protein [Rhodanobacteraceae bacterium]|nr:DUF2064 domain-containing protein [Rhodanobacteraceae bacterium]
MKLRLSVIVPLAPGESEWMALRDQLGALGAEVEVIVVHPVRAGAAHDPGDESFAAPRTAAAWRQIESPCGRARQLNAGARAANGDWLWFLHADSRLHARTLPALRAFVAREESALGYFDLRYRDDGPWLTRLNAFGANLRARALGLPFGDQGFVLPAAWFARLNGYDENAPCSEDHLLVWQARAASLPVRRVGAPLWSSARKYANEGWWRTTARHLILTARQAWPQWRSKRAGANAQGYPPRAMSARDKPPIAALAVFVKTPGLSPVKTRLATSIGQENAIAFHRLAACAVMEVTHAARNAACDLQPYWAVAEHAALDAVCWCGAPRLWQGEGELGARLHRVYASLQARHGRALMIGADAPQLTPALLRAALAALDDPATPFVLGAAADGGFWLFGGRVPMAESIWRGVRYSHARTAGELRAALASFGAIATLPSLTDVDSAADLSALAEALDALDDPLPAQRRLRAWLRDLSVRSKPHTAQA